MTAKRVKPDLTVHEARTARLVLSRAVRDDAVPPAEVDAVERVIIKLTHLLS